VPGRPTKPPTRVLLARHGQTESNRDGLFCGHSETQLTELGREQARSLGQRLAGIAVHAAYSSDFSRAAETAAIALAGRDVGVTPDRELREIHYGDWEMQKERAIAKASPEQFRLMRAEDPRWQPPGGETTTIVRARMLAALARILKRHEHQTTLVISHGTALHCLVAGVLGMPETHVFRLTMANCGLSEIVVRGGRPALALLNETSFLQHLVTAEP
jgi:broad specificity phosphatase PhoE